MLAYIAGSFSTDLNVWKRMVGPCVAQEICHSAITVSVVWLLALDFIFSRCVFPCPGILILDVVRTGGLFNRSRTGAFDFSRPFKRGNFATFRVETLGTCSFIRWVEETIWWYYRSPEGWRYPSPVLLARPSTTDTSKVGEVAELKTEGSAMRCQG